MFLHYRTQGFILKKIDRGEADRIFTIYTRDFGKLDLLAKGERRIKSKLRAGLELFYLSEIEFIQGKAHRTLTDTILIENFKNLRRDLVRLKIAHQISDVLDNLVKGEEADREIWQLLTDTFRLLDKPKILTVTCQLLYYYFLWNFLSILGYQVELYKCSLCQKKITPEDISFSPREGGLIGNECKKKIKSLKPINADTVKMLRIIYKKDSSTLKKLKSSSQSLNELNKISNYYLSSVLEKTR